MSFPRVSVVALPKLYINLTDTKQSPTPVLHPKRGKHLSKCLGELTNNDERRAVIEYIALVAQSVAQS